jgi:hypothetical protein
MKFIRVTFCPFDVNVELIPRGPSTNSRCVFLGIQVTGVHKILSQLLYRLKTNLSIKMAEFFKNGEVKIFLMKVTSQNYFHEEIKSRLNLRNGY